MKTTIFKCAVTVFGLLSTFAFAQNCCYTNDCCNDNGFDGFYIGGNIGVLSHTAHRNDLDGFLTDNSGWTTIDTAFVGGLQAGYDWQCQNKLVGLVVDWNKTANGHTLHENENGGSNHHIVKDLDWYTTIRARAGLVVCDALVYVTGGAAVAQFDDHWRNGDVHFHSDDTRWGWAGGVGTEFNIGCNWSVGAEFLYLNFANDDRTFTDVEDRFTFGHSDSAWTGKFMVNYRFSDLFGCCCR